MSTNNRLLQVNIKLMSLLNMWPDKDRTESKYWRFSKDITILIFVIPSILGICYDFVVQIQGKYDDVLDITENLVALGALFGTIYIMSCFIRNRNKIMIIVEELKNFEQFDNIAEMLATEHKASLYTKLFIFYGIIGVLCYQAVPFLNIEECRSQRARERYSSDIPCELITRFRLPFKYEDSWLLYVAMIIQLYGCLVAVTITIATTMFLIAILMQIIVQMQQLRKMLLSDTSLYKCIRYHSMIIEYAKNVTRAFSSMMLMHITLTSFEISVLGFKVLMVNNRSDSLRFGMHLLGWLMLLFLICFYGQKLIDESTGIGWDAYSTEWYNSPVSVQKDLQLMILRSQRPLTLSAASLGVMSLETYLGVLSTAYSYFTLLLHMKSN